MKSYGKIWLGVCLIVLSGCAVLASNNLDQIYGHAKSENRPVQATSPSLSSYPSTETDFYQTQVRPILESRCVNCHACYDAPCQIKLTAPEGIDRGGSKTKVYEGDRLLAVEPTRLFEDARTTQQWREKGFYPILNEREQSPSANLNGSLLYRAVALRRQQGPFKDTVLPAASYDFSLDRAQECPAVEEYTSFSQSHPTWGMPYGLPALTDQEYNVLTRWLVQGGNMGQGASLPESIAHQVDVWEARFNQGSLKAQLVNRYIYEHLYLYSLYFDENAAFTFKLVRSSTPPGEPIQRISTRRPYDDPKVGQVYYRLWLDHESRVQKTFIPMKLDEARYQRWQTWLYEADYKVAALPSYQIDVASNPFKSFAQIPANGRYRFLLDHAQNTIMAFIKGPVCRGQVAVNVINEQFWVFFVDPDLEMHDIGSRFLVENASVLALPASESSNALPLTSWVSYSEKQKSYLSAKARLIEKVAQKGVGINLDTVWDGDKVNPNAALTVMRHFDNATVEQGLVGPDPKTAWVIDYPLLERIHYLLVAGFDVFGNVGHQLVTRLYMDFLRMEGEMNFLLLLPQDERKKVREYWYRNTDQVIKDYIFSDLLKVNVDSAIAFHTADKKQELFALLEQHLSPVLNHEHDIAKTDLMASTQQSLLSLQSLKGGGVSLFPDIALLLIERDEKAPVLTSIVHNRAHASLTSLLDEESTLLPKEDTFIVTRGVVGDYPNVLFRVQEDQIAQFVKQISVMKHSTDYTELLNQFAIRRTNNAFWQVSDEIARINREMEPLSSGILDYNRLENR